jgi:hypothetical protein
LENYRERNTNSNTSYDIKSIPGKSKSMNIQLNNRNYISSNNLKSTQKEYYDNMLISKEENNKSLILEEAIDELNPNYEVEVLKQTGNQGEIYNNKNENDETIYEEELESMNKNEFDINEYIIENNNCI